MGAGTGVRGTAGGAVTARTSDPWVIAVANQKGGAGKTTLTLGLAATTADSSGRTLVVDVDHQGSAKEIAEMAGDALPFEFAADEDPETLGMLRQIRDYDSIYVDCPGNLTDTAVLEQVLKNADFVVIPFIPEVQYRNPTRRTAQLAVEFGLPYLVVVNGADPLRGSKPVEDAWKMLDGWGLVRARSFIRRYVAWPQSQLEGQMITQYRGDRSWRTALDDMRRLHSEVLIELGRVGASRRQADG